MSRSINKINTSLNRKLIYMPNKTRETIVVRKLIVEGPINSDKIVHDSLKLKLFSFPSP